MDDVAGLKRLVNQLLPSLIDSGRVVSISSGKAMVAIGSDVNSQPCSYDPSSGIAAGDMVIVMKAPRLSQWAITAVVFRKSAGLANSVRETPNNRAGSPRFAKASTNGGGVDSVTAASGQLIASVPMTFNGGKCMVIHNGYATIASGSSLLQLSVGIDGSPTNVWNGSIATVTTPTNFSWIGSDQLYGPHVIQLYAGRTSANVSLTNYQLTVAEI